MKVVDAFSGQVMNVGDVAPTPEGGTMRLLTVRPGLLTASAQIEIVNPSSQLGSGVRTIPLQVRWTHPRFFLQHVAFIPS